MLANDSLFRERLITIMLASPNTETAIFKQQNEIENKVQQFNIDEQQAVKGKFKIDVFYLEDVINEAKPRAQKIVNLLKERYPDYQIRIRLLPRSINAQSGYRISANEIRFEENEKSLALEVQKLLNINKVFQLEKPVLHQITYHTPNYISIFVRNI